MQVTRFYVVCLVMKLLFQVRMISKTGRVGPRHFLSCQLSFRQKEPLVVQLTFACRWTQIPSRSVNCFDTCVFLCSLLRVSVVAREAVKEKKSRIQGGLFRFRACFCFSKSDHLNLPSSSWS